MRSKSRMFSMAATQGIEPIANLFRLILQGIIKIVNSWKMSLPSYRMENKTILLEQVQQLCYKHQNHIAASPRNDPDPVSIQLFVHENDRYNTLPPILISKSEQTYRSNTEQKTSLQAGNKSLIKHRRYRSITYDAECSPRFQDTKRSPNVEALKDIEKRKKFVEVDMLSLLTNYAKKTPIQNNLKEDTFQEKGEQKIVVPLKEDVATFIKCYKFTNDHMNLEQMVKSPHFGVKLMEKQSFYFGDVKEGDMDGRGVMITSNWIFQGEWIRSQKAQGVQITPKGTYKGKFVRNQRSKVGEFFWKNGQYYSGEWLHNQKHGTGVWKSPQGDVYMGQWLNGKVQGYGIHLTRHGQKYEGYFSRFLKHGQGKQYFPNGDFFEGTFKEGKPDGRGTYKWRNGMVYEGDFKQGLRDGKGKIRTINMQYEGQFERQRAHGEGKLTVWNGNSYRGQFKRGKKEGKGISRQSRRIFVGYWKNNRFIHNKE